jgi:hypothetical protein
MVASSRLTGPRVAMILVLRGWRKAWYPPGCSNTTQKKPAPCGAVRKTLLVGYRFLGAAFLGAAFFAAGFFGPLF